jgi:hypothetical protein
VARLLPHSSLVDVLRNSGVVGIEWAKPGVLTEPGSPYYQIKPEVAAPALTGGKPGSTYPYIVLDFPESSVEHGFKSPGGAYYEKYRPVLYIIGTETQVVPLSSPYNGPGQSIVAYLDGIGPSALDGDRFTCGEFSRESYHLKKSDVRAAGTTEWLWEVEVPYEFNVTAQYPLIGGSNG